MCFGQSPPGALGQINEDYAVELNLIANRRYCVSESFSRFGGLQGGGDVSSQLALFTQELTFPFGHGFYGQKMVDRDIRAERISGRTKWSYFSDDYNSSTWDNKFHGTWQRSRNAKSPEVIFELASPRYASPPEFSLNLFSSGIRLKPWVPGLLSAWPPHQHGELTGDLSGAVLCGLRVQEKTGFLISDADSVALFELFDDRNLSETRDWLQIGYKQQKVSTVTRFSNAPFGKILSHICYKYEGDKIVESHYFSHPIQSGKYRELRFEYSYNKSGLLDERTDFEYGSFFPVGRRVYSYDVYGNLAGMRWNTSVGDGGSFSVNYTLDEFNRWTHAELVFGEKGAVEGTYSDDLRPSYYDAEFFRDIVYLTNVSEPQKFLPIVAQTPEGMSHKKVDSIEWKFDLNDIQRSLNMGVVLVFRDEFACIAPRGSENNDLPRLFEIAANRLFNFVPRGEKLNSILDEHRLISQGLLDDTLTPELGTLSGAQFMIFLEHGCVDGRTSFDLHAVEVETGLTVWNFMSIGADFDQFVKRFNEETLAHEK